MLLWKRCIAEKSNTGRDRQCENQEKRPLELRRHSSLVYFGALPPQRVNKRLLAGPLAHARGGGAILPGGLAGDFKLIDDALDAVRIPGYALGLGPLFGGIHHAAQGDDVVNHVYIDLTPRRLAIA